MSQFLGYLSADALASEPISLEEVKTHARIDLDLTDDDLFIQTVLIPSARQQAETRTGSAIRPARYRQVLKSLPIRNEALWLAPGNVQIIESLVYAAPGPSGVRQSMDPATLDLVCFDRESALIPKVGWWPHAAHASNAVEIQMTAGLDPDALAQAYPSVKVWMLMAAAWAYAQREMFLLQTRGAGYQELPTDFMQSLLEPLKIPPRW